MMDFFSGKPNDYSKRVQSIRDLGFSEKDAKDALKHYNYDTAKATNYLFTRQDTKQQNQRI